jgi:hypothetical protein
MTLVANLPPVSTTPAENFAPSFASVVDTGAKLPPVANCHRYQWHWWQICHRCKRHRWQTVGPMIRLPTTKMNLKKKMYLYNNFKTQRCPKEIMQIFWLKIFSICHGCQRHRWCTLSCEYLREFLKKIETAVMVYSGAWGKLTYEKNQKSKISWHCPFNKYKIMQSLFF